MRRGITRRRDRETQHGDIIFVNNDNISKRTVTVMVTMVSTTEDGNSPDTSTEASDSNDNTHKTLAYGAEML